MNGALLFTLVLISFFGLGYYGVYRWKQQHKNMDKRRNKH